MFLTFSMRTYLLKSSYEITDFWRQGHGQRATGHGATGHGATGHGATLCQMILHQRCLRNGWLSVDRCGSKMFIDGQVWVSYERLVG